MTKADTDRLHARLDSVADSISDIKAICSSNTTNIKGLADTVALLLKRDLEMAHKTPCPSVVALSDRVTVLATNAQNKVTQEDQSKRDDRKVIMSILKYVVCFGIGLAVMKLTGG